MAKTRRARTKPDMGAISAAVSRPGIDPRYWIVRARVVDTGFDADNGYFATVEFIPDGEQQTCLIGAVYAGNGFGIYCPLLEDDIVIVSVPDGDPNAGPTIIAREWNAADKPPADGGSGEDPTEHLLIRVRPGKKLKIMTSEVGGDIEIVPEHANGRVKLGDANATRGAARLNDTVDLGWWYTERNGDKDIMWWRLTDQDAWEEIASDAIPPIITTVGTHLFGKIVTASTKVKVEG